MAEHSFIGLEARTPDGVVIGRVSDIITDEETDEVTHLLIEKREDYLEIPITAITLDPDVDFAIFDPDADDVEPGDHVGDEAGPEGYAPIEPIAGEEEDYLHSGQFVTTPVDPVEAQSEVDLARESGEAGGWEDEDSSPDSGYPRNDAYIDPDTGEDVVDPLLKERRGLEDDVKYLLDGTGVQARRVYDGVIELEGEVHSREDLEQIIDELMNLPEVQGVDGADVVIG